MMLSRIKKQQLKSRGSMWEEMRLYCVICRVVTSTKYLYAASTSRRRRRTTTTTTKRRNVGVL